MEFEILYAINNMHGPILDKIMVLITTLGDAGIIWIILALILLCIKKTRKCGILLLLSLVTGLILGNGILKNLVARSRPCWIDESIPLLIPKPHDYSFPSGHTLASFESAIMIFLHNKKWGSVALVIAILISFSRMYLFVHFPTDILGGIILAGVISISLYHLWNKLEKNKRREK
jgi:undecaprenyl-diphosphatase